MVDKWLAVQAGLRLPSTLAEVKRLTAHPLLHLLTHRIALHNSPSLLRRVLVVMKKAATIITS